MEPTENENKKARKTAEFKLLPKVVSINEGRDYVSPDEVSGRSTVEDLLKALLDAEADRLGKSQEDIKEYMDVPVEDAVSPRSSRGRNQPFETAIIERYRNQELSVEETLIEMYLAGVSIRRVEAITEELWGVRVSPSMISELNERIHRDIEQWRSRLLDAEYPYVFLDWLWLKRSWGQEVKNISVLVAIGVSQTGYRDILAVSEGAKEDRASWTKFLHDLRGRGLRGVKLVISDKNMGLVESLADIYPDAKWQHCVTRFYRNVWNATPSDKARQVTAMLKAIHAQEDIFAAREKAAQIIEKLNEMDLERAAEIVIAGVEKTLSYYELPPEHWRYLRTNSPLERLMREIQRRTRVVGSFPDGQSALTLVAAGLRHVGATKWGVRRYMQMNRLAEVVAIA